MPCYDGQHIQTSCNCKAKIDRLTQFLCYMCGDAEEMPEPIKRWWKNHSADDEKRVRQKMKARARHFRTSLSMSHHFIKEAEAMHPVSPYHIDWFVRLAKETFEDSS